MTDSYKNPPVYEMNAGYLMHLTETQMLVLRGVLEIVRESVEALPADTAANVPLADSIIRDLSTAVSGHLDGIDAADLIRLSNEPLPTIIKIGAGPMIVLDDGSRLPDAGRLSRRAKALDLWHGKHEPAQEDGWEPESDSFTLRTMATVVEVVPGNQRIVGTIPVWSREFLVDLPIEFLPLHQRSPIREKQEFLVSVAIGTHIASSHLHITALTPLNPDVKFNYDASVLHGDAVAFLSEWMNDAFSAAQTLACLIQLLIDRYYSGYEVALNQTRDWETVRLCRRIAAVFTLRWMPQLPSDAVRETVETSLAHLLMRYCELGYQTAYQDGLKGK